MRGGIIRLLLSLLGAAMLLGFAPAAQAGGHFPWGTLCHTTAAANETYTGLAAQPWRWQCSDHRWSTEGDKAFLRFDLRGGPEPAAARALVTRLTRFERMALSAVDGAGRVLASRTVGEADMRPASNDWLMSVELPQSAEQPEAIVVEVSGARHAGMLSEARLVASAGDTPASLRQELLIAALCGLLCMPLILNFAFYRVLRDRFLLWHALAVVFMFVQTLVTSGLINRFAAPSLAALCFLSAVSWGGGIAAAALFSADFMEPGKLNARHRRALRLTAIWIPCWTAFYLLADGGLRPLAAPLYFMSFIPVLGTFTWVMVAAKRRGSRAVNFQIFAWLPIMLVGATRILSMLGLTGPMVELQLEQHVALGLEVIITTLGAADRFVTIRRQRDRAWAQSRRFEELAERDALTGLFNRRHLNDTLPTLFALALREDRPLSVALIDLDHFKAVNDQHGHDVGDQVLAAFGTLLLSESRHSDVVCRYGGEEFCLLMPHTPAAAAGHKLRGLLQRWPQQAVAPDGQVLGGLSFTAGVCDTTAGKTSCQQLLKAADEALLAGKRAGRAQVRLASFPHAADAA